MSFKTLFLGCLIIFLSACGGGGGGGSNPAPPPCDCLNINLLSQTRTIASGSITTNPGSLTYRVTREPLLGTVSLDTRTSTYTYTTKYNDIPISEKDNFDITDSNGVITLITVNLNTDPLIKYQWHLDNRGQLNFDVIGGGTAGEDINVDGVIAQGLTGAGVIVAVVDSGLEIAHEDLRANVVRGGSHNFITNGNDPTPDSSKTGPDHGTSVAGLIASRGWNNLGGRGVAPSAQLKGFNFTGSIQRKADNIFALGSGGVAYSNDVEIFNQSYGKDNHRDILIDPALEAAYKNGVESLRGGKGAIYIKSAGNGFNSFGVTICSGSNLSCQNANMDPVQTLPYNITVGALNADGVKSSYSSAGSNIWVSAPGGAIGRAAPRLITTDQSGCNKGYSTSPSSDDPNCNYTTIFNGTSSSAPITSGVVALMLEARDDLTWRDVKHILASTADQVDASIATTVLQETQTSTKTGTTVTATITYDAEPAWLTNNANFKFHNYYGFGRINASNAVSAAKAYVIGSLGTLVIKDWNNSGALSLGQIPDISTTGVSHTITDSSNLTIEAVQIRVNVTHTFTGELAIELTSPSGTKSVLFNTYNGFYGDDDLDNMVLLSNAFYGENSSGNWTIKVIDAGLDDTGMLNNWSIRIFGH